MDLYIVRHGIAEETAHGGGGDADRELTEEGKERCREVGHGMLQMGVKPEIVLTSPLKRAIQTAEILAKTIGAEETIESLDSLAPRGDHEETIKYLARCRKSAVMLVGHMPDLSELASFLVAGNAEAGFHFKKAAMLVLSVDGTPRKGSAVVEGFLQPGILRSLRKG